MNETDYEALKRILKPVLETARSVRDKQDVEGLLSIPRRCTPQFLLRHEGAAEHGHHPARERDRQADAKQSRRNMSYPIKEIRERIRRWWFDRDFYESQWPEPYRDAVALGVIVTRLVKQVHELNDASPEPADLCPECGDFKWGRPQLPGGGQNMSKRKCHDCGEVRAEWQVISTESEKP